MINNMGLVIEKLVQHIEITLIAVLLAVVIGVPLGIMVSKNKQAGKFILGVANIFQTIPSLALFGFIIPLPIIGGIGYRPAVIVLFLYALLPIIKNTYIGIESVDDAIVESARGMGMTQRQILFMVTMPLAFPIIMGGIRVATVINIGTATIAALIGAGGLGDFIFRGISMSDSGIILAGAIPTTVLALFLDFLLGIAERKMPIGTIGHIISKKKNKAKIGKLAIASIVVFVIGVGFYNQNSAGESHKLRIGTKNYTESRLLGQLMSVYISENTDYETEMVELGGTFPTFKALETGNIDMYMEYTGTAYLTILKKEGGNASTEEVYKVMKDEFKDKYDIEVLNPLGYNNTYTLAVTKALAEQYGLERFSDLVAYSDEMILGATTELLERPDGYKGLKALYGFEFETNALDPGLRYNAIEGGQVQVIDAFSTDGKIIELDLKILEDDKAYFAPYYSVPVVNGDTARRHEDVVELLKNLGDILDEEQMQQLNYQADVENMDLKDVARDFLKKKNMID